MPSIATKNTILAATLAITAFLDGVRMTVTLAIVSSLNAFGISRAIVYANYFPVKRTAMISCQSERFRRSLPSESQFARAPVYDEPYP